MKKIVRFISVIPYFPGREKYLAQLIRDRYRITGIEEYALSLPIHPQGKDIMSKIKIQKRCFGALKQLLDSLPEIRLGILFQSTLGHGGHWNAAPQSDIKATHIVDQHGHETPRCCPYDSRFLDYIFEAVSMLAAGKPAFTLTDDDMRMFNETCFCSLHLKEISRRMGKEYSRNELAELLENAPEHSGIAEVFEETQIDAMLRLCKTVRNALDTVDSSISCACCVVHDRFNYAEAEAKMLAGKAAAPFLRINNGAYTEVAIRDIAHVNLRTEHQVMNIRQLGMELLDESDTCPHNRFSKSANTMHLHIASGLVRGLDGGKLWLDQGVFPLREISRPYEEIIGKNRGFYNTLHELAQRWTPVGIHTVSPFLNQEAYPYKGISFGRSGDWGANCLGQLGFPFFYAPEGTGGIQALSGRQVEYFSDEQLTGILSGPLLLDGEGAGILTQRGFASLIGVSAQDRAFHGNIEHLHDGNMDLTFSGVDKAPFLSSLPGAEVLSTVQLALYKGDKINDIMPGSIFFQNELGGKVVTLALSLDSWHEMWVINPGRKIQYCSVLRKLGMDSAFLNAFQHVNLYSAMMSDGAVVHAVSNLSYDSLPLALAGIKKMQSVEYLAASGEFIPLDFAFADGEVVTGLHLAPAECAVVRFRF